MSSFTYNPASISHLESMLSSDRFETYVKLASGNKRKALRLYKKNILISHRFYTIIHILEVCLRNKIDECLIKRFGSNWYENQKLGLSLVQSKMLKEIPKDEKRGKVIASLPFGFWSSFFGRSFELLWRQNIRFIFNEEIPLKRSNIAAYLKDIRILRNRIAHHECILKMDVHGLEKGAIEFLTLLSPITAAWLKAELLNSAIPLV
jgi:hypothetical protein